MKKRLVEILIFLVTVIIMGVLGGLYSLVFAGVAGGTALSLAPKYNFELVGKYVCPEGTQLQYDNGQNPASGTDHVDTVKCVGQDGMVIQGMKSRATMSVIGMYFLLCFVPTYLPGVILLWIFLNREFPRFFDESPVPQDDEEDEVAR
jgi:hypothetical protein